MSTQPVRVAALDVGSNSFHLIVVEVSGEGRVTVLDRAKEMVRLGDASLRDGVIPPEAFERGIAALRKLREVARRHDPESIVAVGTSAVREASNGPAFIEAARRQLDLEIRAIDGLEEAKLIYQGARQVLPFAGGRAALFDLGGGSLEAIVGDAQGCLFAASLKIGVLRCRDLWQWSDPPSAAQRAAAGAHIQALVQPVLADMKRVGFDLVALSSGTARALARLVAVAGDAAGSGESPTTVSLDGLRALEDTLARLTIAERTALPGVDQRRADTILPGAIILRTVLEMTGGREAIVCEAALREGMIADYIARRSKTDD